jgi:hypothetical protein
MKLLLDQTLINLRMICDRYILIALGNTPLGCFVDKSRKDITKTPKRQDN